jgi:putative membrane protein
MRDSHSTLKTALAAFVLLSLAASAIHPKDMFTWFLEVVPIFIAAPLLFLTRDRFPLTPLLACLVALHGLVLIVGGHYTYAEAPFGFWMEKTFGLVRNQYDRVGHFMQGFVPALAAREVLLRKTALKRGRMLALLCLCVALAVSASYEIFEMVVARLTGEAADAFLGTQGDPWDTQMDMGFALIGGAVSMLLLPRLHDRQLKGLKKK